jgi:hypothetical protein
VIAPFYLNILRLAQRILMDKMTDKTPVTPARAAGVRNIAD